ncbi:hypothetical protein PHYBOEH_010465 [Phytophthora boehmeriae]|uniref:RNase III domain-containing protein n=1 Tax=Phytophthora boehmeriae TaxID=109152 RepID=A0A8T1VR39_9STRA|nr:hypothetical protein PHYBOEH_010465 [Phytophthora boehmeriae]
MTKKRRVSRPSHRRRAFSESDVRLSPKKRPKVKPDANSETSGYAADSVAHFQALQCSSSSAALAEVYEWLGDAVIGELVGRCLLSQFHQNPLSARVFRNLRLAVVTNRNLALVYDAMGYDSVRRKMGHFDPTLLKGRAEKIKTRADVVEAVVGELVLRLHAHKQSSVAKSKSEAEAYRTHLDSVLATMLHTHFAERSKAAEERGETVLAAKGPLSVAFNPFACLPEEQLDEQTGELVVRDGVFQHEVFDEEVKGERSFSDLIDEYKDGAGVKNLAQNNTPHHYFLPIAKIDAAARLDMQQKQNDKEDFESPSGVQLVRLAMLQLDDAHILRSSSEIFEVFKIYGMAVLSERMSLLLAMPHASIGNRRPTSSGGSNDTITPGRLTRQRQLALSVANLAACAASLGIVLPFTPQERDGTVVCGRKDDGEEALRQMQEQHGCANSLRAFVGYHSAVATTSTAATRRSNTLVTTICVALYDAAISIQPKGGFSVPPPSAIPEREPLVAMMRSVGETRMFMCSKTCDDLHARGERPFSAATSEREKRQQASYMLRRCDSEALDDLFETLAKEQGVQQKPSETKHTDQSQRKKKSKKKKKLEVLGAKAACVTGSLERFLHRRFLFCLEDIIVLFAQRKTEACRARIDLFENDLEPCADASHFRKWEVSTSTLTLAMRDSFYRLLLHDICQFHAVVSSSKNTRDGTRITQLRLPLHYTWSNIDCRITTEQQARC